MKEKIFESKVALITGGAGGIGFAVAELLIQKGIAHVILIDTNKNMLEESACKLDSERVHTCILDITKEIEVKNAIKKINEKYKRIDLLVNMAGIAGPSARTENYSFDAFQKVFSVNVFGTFLMMKYCLPFMQKQKSDPLHARSCSGLMGYKLEIGYGSSKSAVLGMTRNAAAENGSNGKNKLHFTRLGTYRYAGKYSRTICQYRWRIYYGDTEERNHAPSNGTL